QPCPYKTCGIIQPLGTSSKLVSAVPLQNLRHHTTFGYKLKVSISRAPTKPAASYNLWVQAQS
ncbi:hypothetical protein, partial [Microseira wollei]|uniref:hypothetical protein n=1 Tax=Microseira wollei TaxID=467598 RepID=UPI001CFD8A72